MAKKQNGRTIILLILAFGIVFTGALVATMRTVGLSSENFDPPDVALPARR